MKMKGYEVKSKSPSEVHSPKATTRNRLFFVKFQKFFVLTSVYKYAFLETQVGAYCKHCHTSLLYT